MKIILAALLLTSCSYFSPKSKVERKPAIKTRQQMIIECIEQVRSYGFSEKTVVETCQNLYKNF